MVQRKSRPVRRPLVVVDVQPDFGPACDLPVPSESEGNFRGPYTNKPVGPRISSPEYWKASDGTQPPAFTRVTLFGVMSGTYTPVDPTGLPDVLKILDATSRDDKGA